MNILIIEDDILLAEKIKKIFQSKVITNRVYVAYSFEDFTHQLPILSSFDIVLTDIKLSSHHTNMDGYEIIQIIRKKNLKIPVVVIS
jgi:CheY-like chemotaxis protein